MSTAERTTNGKGGGHLSLDIETAFPILTTPVQPGTSTGDRADGDLGRRARNAISDVLGLNVRASDPKTFVAALTNSFALRTVEGRTEATYTPQGYSVQADLGAVTGAQASLAGRARTAVQDSLQLLDSLVPLRVDFDPESGAGFRELVRYDLEQLRQELQSPVIRVPRVDQLFQLLLFTRENTRPLPVGAETVVTPDNARGHLGMLRDAFGLVARLVGTVNDERVQTSFITIVDWVLSLHQSWLAQRGRIDPFNVPAGVEGFFGPTMLAISQLLAATVSQVDELASALDSVLINAGEREVLRAPVPADPDNGFQETSMPLGRLLSWIRDFAASEGRKLVESAGKDGVDSAFFFVALRLDQIVTALPCTPHDSATRLPDGFFTRRVQVAVRALEEDLRAIVRLVDPVRHPDPDPDPGTPLVTGGPPVTPPAQPAKRPPRRRAKEQQPAAESTAAPAEGPPAAKEPVQSAGDAEPRQ